MIADKLSKFYDKESVEDLDVLDLGCGTGLCGELISNYVKYGTLIGVDLSPNMLAVANDKNVYNQLVEADLLSYCNEGHSLCDVVIAADVFTYFGALEDIVESISRRLKTGGRFVFSISENNISNDDYKLHISGRFTHTKKYIEGILKNADLRVHSFDDEILRVEGNEPVRGWIISAFK